MRVTLQHALSHTYPNNPLFTLLTPLQLNLLMIHVDVEDYRHRVQHRSRLSVKVKCHVCQRVGQMTPVNHDEWIGVKWSKWVAHLF